jgi:Asp-tRNA(Asn)/Glu-tRNA(Gln) amidotransferase A subunit family amidase
VPRGHFFENLEPAVAAAVERFLQSVKSQGAVLIEEDIPNVKALDEAVSFVLVNFEARRTLERYLERSAPGISFDKVVAGIVSPDVKAVYAAIAKEHLVSKRDYSRAINMDRPALQKAIHDYLRMQQLDAYVVPTCSMTARPLGQDETVELNGEQVPTFMTYIRNADPSSNAGTPSITIPVGLTESGLPVGVMIEAASGSDRRLLAVAKSLEQLCGPFPAPKLKAQ